MKVSQIHDYSGMITTTPSHIDTHENMFVVTLPHDNKICEGSFSGRPARTKMHRGFHGV